MKITGITAYQLDLPLTVPYWLSGRRLRFDTLDSTLVAVLTDTGLIGWGESCPWGQTYLPAFGGGVRAGLQALGPTLIGLDPRSLDHVNRQMDVAMPGHPYVKSALDMACWDLLGQFAKMPLWQLMGGAAADPVAVNSSISTGTPEEMIDHISQASDAGYRTHSAKIGGTDTAIDIARIQAIEAALPPGEQVTFDVNRAWTPATAIAVLSAAGSSSWVEQPCETLHQCAHVAGKVPNPIMLDECLHTMEDHHAAWRLRANEGIKIKPNRVGGLTRARQIRDFAISVGWCVHIEDTGGTVLADTAAIHLASATPADWRLASWLGHHHLAIDPIPEQGARNHNGYATPPSVPGLGITPDPGQFGNPVLVIK